MSKLNKRDRKEFSQYLAQCTDDQVRGVYEKEKAAQRRAYSSLAKDEAAKRGISIR